MATRKPARPQRSRTRTSQGRKARSARKTAAAPSRKAPAPPEKPRREPETLRVRTFTPGFTVDDLQRSLTFYTEALGFVVSELWSDDQGQVRGAMLKAGACELGLSQDDWSKGRDRKKGQGVRVWCETAQDIDALARRVKAAGFSLTEEPKDEPWGGRAFSLDDPDGFHLTVFRQV